MKPIAGVTATTNALAILGKLYSAIAPRNYEQSSERGRRRHQSRSRSATCVAHFSKSTVVDSAIRVCTTSTSRVYTQRKRPLHLEGPFSD